MEKVKSPNTSIEYMYRDEAGYKAYEIVILEGSLTKEQKIFLMEKFGDGSDGFIPSQIGLKDIQGELQQYDTADHDLDHCFHSICEILEVDENPTLNISAKQFFHLMKTTSWDSSKPISHIKF